jgi:hypothetical protein
MIYILISVSSAFRVQSQIVTISFSLQATIVTLVAIAGSTPVETGMVSILSITFGMQLSVRISF